MQLSARALALGSAIVFALPLAVAHADAVPSTSYPSTSHPSTSYPSTSRAVPSSVPSVDGPWERLSGPSLVAPPGWHKEGGVWQRTDGTPLPDSNPGQTINDLIRRQHDLERGDRGTWMLATLMSYLRALDPITLASAQISAFCLLAYRVLRRE